MIETHHRTRRSVQELWNGVLGCERCSFRQECASPVPWSGPPSSRVFFLGEAPGVNEDQNLRPWDGPAGREFDQYMFKSGIGSRGQIRVSNVIRCHNKRESGEITMAEAEECHKWTVEEVEQCNPEVVVPMGQLAIRILLQNPGATVDDTHGIPVWGSIGDWFGIILPMYNPASAMFAGERQSNIIKKDFGILKDVLDGTHRWITDGYRGREDYSVWERGSEVDLVAIIRENGYFCIDTETTPDGKVWCATICVVPGVAYTVFPDHLGHFAEVLSDPDVRVVMHNAPFDVRKLQDAGYSISNIDDTMVMAYILGDQPQALKDLAKRLCGMEMEDYTATVKPSQERLTRAYWLKALKVKDKLSKPEGKKQTIIQKMRRATLDKGKGTLGELGGRWKSWPVEQREELEGMIGPFPVASMATIPRAKAVWYASRDADATARVMFELTSMLTNRDTAAV